MPIIENRFITSTDWKPGDKPKDALGFCDGQSWEVRNCIIDLTDAPDGSVDEACGITWGSEAHFKNCVIRGAGKLVLCGSGDEEHIDEERGKYVTFSDCVLEDFCRRGPEVQDGMYCVMTNCLVTGWGYYKKFDTRAFGAWAHKGGHITAESCLFFPKRDVHPWYWLKDHWNHFWQCVNERGFFKALTHRDAWLSGYKRALTAGPDGTVHAMNCYAPEGYVIDNHDNPMGIDEAAYRYSKLMIMADSLYEELAETN